MAAITGITRQSPLCPLEFFKRTATSPIPKMFLFNILGMRDEWLENFIYDSQPLNMLAEAGKQNICFPV